MQLQRCSSTDATAQYTAFDPKQLCDFKLYLWDGDDNNMSSQGFGE